MSTEKSQRGAVAPCAQVASDGAVAQSPHEHGLGGELSQVVPHRRGRRGRVPGRGGNGLLQPAVNVGIVGVGGIWN